ncbi:Hypothetical protein AKI40_4205 [Enterobacter sp. FY-07]|nr:Hypothetical protein AKI40_4205 [Enterobacter sp. FY-07]
MTIHHPNRSMFSNSCIFNANTDATTDENQDKILAVKIKAE